MRVAHLAIPTHPLSPTQLCSLAPQGDLAGVEPIGDRSRSRSAGASGQATAEYALVLLGAAAVALMLTAWATKSGAIGELFDTVVEQLRSKVP